MTADPQLRNLGFITFVSILCIWGVSLVQRILKYKRAVEHIRSGNAIVKPFKEIIEMSMAELVEEHTTGSQDATLLPCLELPFQMIEKAQRLEAQGSAAALNAALGSAAKVSCPPIPRSGGVPSRSEDPYGDSTESANLGSKQQSHTSAFDLENSAFVTEDCPFIDPVSLAIIIPLRMNGAKAKQTVPPSVQELDARLLINVDAADIVAHADGFTKGKSFQLLQAQQQTVRRKKEQKITLGGSNARNELVSRQLSTPTVGKSGSTNFEHHRRTSSISSSGLGATQRSSHDGELFSQYSESDDCVDGLKLRPFFVPIERRSYIAPHSLEPRTKQGVKVSKPGLNATPRQNSSLSFLPTSTPKSILKPSRESDADLAALGSQDEVRSPNPGSDTADRAETSPERNRTTPNRALGRRGPKVGAAKGRSKASGSLLHPSIRTGLSDHLLKGKLMNHELLDQLLADAEEAMHIEELGGMANDPDLHSVVLAVAYPDHRLKPKDGVQERIVAYYAGYVDPKRGKIRRRQPTLEELRLNSTQNQHARASSSVSSIAMKPQAQSPLLADSPKRHAASDQAEETEDRFAGLDETSGQVASSFFSVDDQEAEGSVNRPVLEERNEECNEIRTSSTLPPKKPPMATKSTPLDAPISPLVALEQIHERQTSSVNSALQTAATSELVHPMNFTLTYIAHKGEVFTVKELFIAEEDDEVSSVGSSSPVGDAPNTSNSQDSTPTIARRHGRHGDFEGHEREMVDFRVSGTSASPLCKLPLCTICYSKRVSTVTLPCRHYLMCEACCKKLSECPVCRTGIEGTITTME